MTAFSFMSSVFPVDQGPLKKINCCSQSMISASSFVHNALEVSLASLGLDLAFCNTPSTLATTSLVTVQKVLIGWESTTKARLCTRNTYSA